MNFELSRFTDIFRILVVIPVIVGLMTLAEFILPMQHLDSVVIDKKETTSIKRGFTKTVYFSNISEQFDEEIFNLLNVGDSVVLQVTAFNKAVKGVTLKSANKTLANNSNEWIFMFGFAIAFILSGAIWFKKGFLTNRQSFYVFMAIVLGTINAVRIFFL